MESENFISSKEKEEEKLAVNSNKELDEPINNKSTNNAHYSWIWYLISIIFFIIMFVYLFNANKYVYGDAKIFGNNSSNMDEQYVGGDAYNFIIAGTYSIAQTIRALIFALLGCTSLIMGRLRKK